MQKKITFKIRPSFINDEGHIKKQIAAYTSVAAQDVTGYLLLKKSLDARGKESFFVLTVLAFINEPVQDRELRKFIKRDVSKSAKKVVIIGAGPAGLFAAISLIENGIKPIILERGKNVRERRRDLALLNKKGEINPNSNYCFGEGGAGTYSDGKLYTRSSKRGDIESILHLFVQFGADENILYTTHPHIGTNKLPAIIATMRDAIVECGGEVHFETMTAGITLKDGSVAEISTNDGRAFTGDAFIFATGHSARDIFYLLHHNGIKVEAKPFALGVRIEHPQDIINNIQYGRERKQLSDALPPASYSLVDQVEERGVFSFCMCPGGIIAPAATSFGELVVNGWSPSKRNNPYANSGMVVQLELKDVDAYYAALGRKKNEGDPFMMLAFQQEVEKSAFEAGGGKFVAPAQRLIDFNEGKLSTDLPKCSYTPGTHSALLNEVLPGFIASRLQEALQTFRKKMPARNNLPGYYTNEAIVVATESRTSSPVRIPRDPQLLVHPSVKNLYPCGEGAGYAGGIVSAAMDGQRVAKAIALI